MCSSFGGQSRTKRIFFSIASSVCGIFEKNKNNEKKKNFISKYILLLQIIHVCALDRVVLVDGLCNRLMAIMVFCFLYFVEEEKKIRKKKILKFSKLI